MYKNLLAVISVVFFTSCDVFAVDISLCNQFLLEQQEELFDSLVPEESLYHELKALRRSVTINSSHYLFKNREKTFGELVEIALARQEMILDFLKESVARPEVPKVLADAIVSGTKDVERLKFIWGKLESSHMGLKVKDLETQFPPTLFHDLKAFFGTFHGMLKGSIGEMEVASMVNGLTQFSVIGDQVVPKESVKALLAQKNSKKWRKKIRFFLKFEMDIVSNDGLTWGEVKTSSFGSSKEKKEHILRARKLSSLIWWLNRLGHDINMHYYFVGQRPSTEIQSDLESLGFQVYFLP